MWTGEVVLYASNALEKYFASCYTKRRKYSLSSENSLDACTQVLSQKFCLLEIWNEKPWQDIAHTNKSEISNGIIRKLGTFSEEHRTQIHLFIYKHSSFQERVLI